MEGCKNNDGRFREWTMRVHFGNLRSGLRPWLNVESTRRDFDGQLGSGARSVIRKTNLGLRAETACVAKVVGATFPSPEAPDLMEHASRLLWCPSAVTCGEAYRAVAIPPPLPAGERYRLLQLPSRQRSWQLTATCRFHNNGPPLTRGHPALALPDPN